MSDHIQIDTDALKEKAKQIEACRIEQKEIINQLTKTIINLDSIWHGESREWFISKFMGMYKYFGSFSDAIHEYAELLIKCSDGMEYVDGEVERNIRL